MTAASKKLIKFLIRIIITAGLLIWVFSQIDFEQFLKTVKSAKWQFLVAVWIFTVILFWIRSIKMRLILKKQDCLISTNTIFGATAVTCLYGLILPGILSTGVKWYILKKGTGKSSNVLCSMIYNQWLIMTIMMVFGLAALMFTNPASLSISSSANQQLVPVVCGIILIAVIAVSLLLLNSRTGGKITKTIAALLKPLPEKIRQKGLEMLAQITTFQSAGAGFHLKITAISIIDTLIGGVIIYMLSARAANVNAPVSTFVWLCALIYILGRLPVSIANLGVREAMLVVLLAPYGVEKPQALLMSMILFSALIVMAVIGAGYQIFWSVTAKKSHPPINNA
ncbi:MAG: lysylphosphatidylglycerol synthase transmembrane domain-containing protein [Sedimentisphaerales bacterium]|nr:lysylphosphatidylglycerol synthase transmembrane domain-containing protein [Sedimentisphaerales bacterium]